MAAPQYESPSRTGYQFLMTAMREARLDRDFRILSSHISNNTFYGQPLPSLISDMEKVLLSKDPKRKFAIPLTREQSREHFLQLLREIESDRVHGFYEKIEYGLNKGDWSDLPVPLEEAHQATKPVAPPPAEAEKPPQEPEKIVTPTKRVETKRPFKASAPSTKKTEEKKSSSEPAKTLPITAAASSQTIVPPESKPSVQSVSANKNRINLRLMARSVISKVSPIVSNPLKNVSSSAVVQIIRHPAIRSSLISAGIGGIAGYYLGGPVAAAPAALIGGLIGPNIGQFVGENLTHRFSSQPAERDDNDDLGGAAFEEGGDFGGSEGGFGRGTRNPFRIASQARNLARGGAAAGRIAVGFFAANWEWIVPVTVVAIILLIAFLLLTCSIPGLSSCGGLGSATSGNQVTIQKSGPLQVDNGSKIDYKITVTNKGTSAANVTVSDNIPDNTTYLNGDNDPAPDGTDPASIRSVQWKISNLAAGQSKVLNLSIQPQIQDTWIVNSAIGTSQSVGGSNGSFTPSGQGLLCVDDVDPRLVQFFESAGVSSGVAPAILYGIAKGENGGSIEPWSIDGKLHPISPCGAHGLMQIQHINDGLGKNYGPSCASIGGTANPPEVFDGLKASYNDKSGGNIVDADADKDSIFGAAYYVQERSWPSDRSVTDQLTDEEVVKVSSSYLGTLNAAYAQQYINGYHNAYAKQNTCKQ